MLFLYLTVCFGWLHTVSKQTLTLTRCDRLSLKLCLCRTGGLGFSSCHGWLSAGLTPCVLITNMAVVQKSSQGSGRTDLMCPAPSPSYRRTLQSNRSSKHWRQRRRHCSNILTSRFSQTIPCLPPIRGGEHGCMSRQDS